MLESLKYSTRHLLCIKPPWKHKQFWCTKNDEYCTKPKPYTRARSDRKLPWLLTVRHISQNLDRIVFVFLSSNQSWLSIHSTPAFFLLNRITGVPKTANEHTKYKCTCISRPHYLNPGFKHLLTTFGNYMKLLRALQWLRTVNVCGNGDGVSFRKNFFSGRGGKNTSCDKNHTFFGVSWTQNNLLLLSI